MFAKDSFYIFAMGGLVADFVAKGRFSIDLAAKGSFYIERVTASVVKGFF